MYRQFLDLDLKICEISPEYEVKNMLSALFFNTITTLPADNHYFLFKPGSASAPHAGISYIAPHLNNLYFLTLCQRYGVYQVIRWLFMLKLGLSAAMLLAGADHIYLLCIFIARYGHAHPLVHADVGSDMWQLVRLHNKTRICLCIQILC